MECKQYFLLYVPNRQVMPFILLQMMMKQKISMTSNNLSIKTLKLILMFPKKVPLTKKILSFLSNFNKKHIMKDFINLLLNSRFMKNNYLP